MVISIVGKSCVIGNVSNSSAGSDCRTEPEAAEYYVGG